MSVRGIVDATRESGTGAPGALLGRSVNGVPLVLWGFGALRRVLAADAITVVGGGDGVRSVCERAGIAWVGPRPRGDGSGVVVLDPSRPLCGASSIRRAIETKNADLRAFQISALERIRVRDEGELEAFAALAKGLGPAHALTAGVSRLRLPVGKRIEAVVTDVDGCLTDGTLFRDGNGGVSRGFCTKDGIGHQVLEAAGIKVGWLSTAMEGDAIRLRAQSLGVGTIDVSTGDKGPRFEALCVRMGVEPGRVVYLGDDTNDLPAMERAGWCACPADAHPAVRARADVLLERAGGRGCFRELADLVAAGGAWV